MGANRREKRAEERPEHYEPTPYTRHIMTPEQAEAFERRQAEPPCPPTEAEREAVRMFYKTVRR